MRKKTEISYDLPLRIALWEKDIAYKMPGEIAKEYNIEVESLKMDDLCKQLLI